MEERELALWKGVVEALAEDSPPKRLWKPECIDCNMYDHIEDTGCFLNKCKLTNEETWL